MFRQKTALWIRNLELVAHADRHRGEEELLSLEPLPAGAQCPPCAPAEVKDPTGAGDATGPGFSRGWFWGSPGRSQPVWERSWPAFAWSNKPPRNTARKYSQSFRMVTGRNSGAAAGGVGETVAQACRGDPLGRPFFSAIERYLMSLHAKKQYLQLNSSKAFAANPRLASQFQGLFQDVGRLLAVPAPTN